MLASTVIDYDLRRLKCILQDDLLILAIFRYWEENSQISQNSLITKLW